MVRSGSTALNRSSRVRFGNCLDSTDHVGSDNVAYRSYHDCILVAVDGCAFVVGMLENEAESKEGKSCDRSGWLDQPVLVSKRALVVVLSKNKCKRL